MTREICACFFLLACSRPEPALGLRMQQADTAVLDKLRASANGSRPILTVELTNGLGNQLFQVAALVSVGLDNWPSYSVALPRSKVVGGNRSAYWGSVLRKLGPLLVQASPPVTTAVAGAVKPQTAAASNCTIEQVAHFDPWGKNCSVATQFNPSWFERGLRMQKSSKCPELRLRGYFQNGAFFLHRLPLLRHLFWDDGFAKNASRSLQALLPKRANRTTVSIHYRLGDYEPNGWVLDRGYYDQALLEVQKRSPGSAITCIIFSDEPNRAWQRSMALEGCNERVLVPKSENTATSFYMMSLTDASIIADSTFSYFAALLGQSKRLVVAPSVEGPLSACWSYMKSGPGSDKHPTWLQVPASLLSSGQLLADEILEMAPPADDN